MVGVKSPLQIVVDWLVQNGTTLYTSTAGRIARDRLPSGYSNSQAAIVASLASCKPHLSTGVLESTVTFRCYGGTTQPKDAETVGLLLTDRLQMAGGNVSEGGLVLAQQIDGMTLIDPDTGWPYYASRWRVLTK